MFNSKNEPNQYFYDFTVRMQNPDQIFDELLVLNAQSGDTKAFGLLVKRWNNKIHQHINWMINDRELANDISQECWIVVHRTLSGLSDPRKFGSWMMRIAHNKAIDFIRKNKRLEETKAELKRDAQSNILEPVADKEELFKSLKVGLALLGQDQLMVIRMHYLQELSLIQISEILEIPQGTVKSRLFKSREKLKEIIKRKEKES